MANLIQLKTADLTLLVTGPELPVRAGQIRMSLRCSEPVTWEVAGTPVDGDYTGVPVLDWGVYVVTAWTRIPLEISHPGLTWTAAGPELYQGTLDLRGLEQASVLTVRRNGEDYLTWTLEAAPCHREIRSAMDAELRRYLARIALTALVQEDPGFPDPSQPDALTKAVQALLDLADPLLTALEEPSLTQRLKGKHGADTPENRLVKHCLRAAARRLTTLPGDSLDAAIGALNGRAQTPALESVGAWSAQADAVGAMAPAYQQVYRQWLRLLYLSNWQTGLCLADLPLPELYRLWCLLTMGAQLQEGGMAIRVQSLVQCREGQLEYHLSAADTPFLILRDPQTEGELSLQIQDVGFWSIWKAPRPVLRLQRDRQIFLLDADYGFDGTWEALAAIQNLRHGIAGAQGPESTAFGLHPGRQPVEDPRMVLAVPGQRDTLQGLLDWLVRGIPMVEYREFTLPEETEAQLAKVDWSQRSVLVGALRNEKQLEICLKRRFYHIPVSLVPRGTQPIRYVAIYQSRKLFGDNAGICYWGEVAEYNAVPRHTIREIPSYSDEPYYRFAIRSWQKLPTPIRLQDPGAVNRMTSLFLLRTSRVDTTLWLETESQHRMYLLLEQLLRQASQEPQQIVACQWEGLRIAVDRGMVLIFRDRQLRASFPASRFVQRPHLILQDLRDLVETE